MAGLLALPTFAAFSSRLFGKMAMELQKLDFPAEVGITVAGTAPDFHGVPFSSAAVQSVAAEPLHCKYTTDDQEFNDRATIQR